MQTEKGATTIADTVVTKVASIATREIGGVYELGGGAARVVGSLTQRVGIGDQRTQGVSVEVGEKEAAVDLTIVVEYGEVDPEAHPADPGERDPSDRGDHRAGGDRGQRDGQRPALSRRRSARRRALPRPIATRGSEVIEYSRVPAAEPWPPESERVRLARAARQATLTVRGVRGMDARAGELVLHRCR